MSKLFPQLSKYVAKCKISKRPPASRKLLFLLSLILASIYFLCFSSSFSSGGSNEDSDNDVIEGAESENGGGDGGSFLGDYFNPNSEGRRGHYLPGCVIIGVRKCGTRALIDMLNLHPQVNK